VLETATPTTAGCPGKTATSCGWANIDAGIRTEIFASALEAEPELLITVT